MKNLVYLIFSLAAFPFQWFCTSKPGLCWNSQKHEVKPINPTLCLWLCEIRIYICTCAFCQTSKAPFVVAVCLTHLWDFLPSMPLGPEPQSWAWMIKVYSFCSSQSTRPRALSWPSPDVPFSTTASNGASSPWMLNAQISPRGQKEGRAVEERERGGGLRSVLITVNQVEYRWRMNDVCVQIRLSLWNKSHNCVFQENFNALTALSPGAFKSTNYWR